MKTKDFIDAISEPAQVSSIDSKIPASFVIAEAALESAWGSSKLATDGFNLFGVKADQSWMDKVLTMTIREFINGQWVMVQAKFRKYNCWLDSIKDHSLFLITNQRYKAAFQTSNSETFAKAVAQAGYATDQNYAGKIIAMMRFHNLYKFDKS